MQPRISMITLGVKNVPVAAEFYEKGLGFPRLDFESDSVAFFNLNGSWLGLYGLEDLAEDAQVASEGSGFNGFSLAHNVNSESEVDAVMAQAIAAGGLMVKQPQKVFWGGYSGYFQDPDGHLWEIAYNPIMWVGPDDR